MKGGLNDNLRDSADYTDFQAEWRAVEKAVDAGFEAGACTRWGISARGAREVWMAYRQLLSIGSRGKSREMPEPDFTAARPAVVRAMMESFADHVGVRNGVAANTCRMAGGVGGRLAEGSVAFHGEHFVAAEVAELSGKAVETRVGRCTLIDPEELRAVWPERFSGGEAAVFDAVLRRVRLHRRLMYEDLVLEDRDRGDAPPELAAPILAERVVDGTLKLVKWDAAVEQWIRRLNGLSVWMPELELPRFSEEDRAGSHLPGLRGGRGLQGHQGAGDHSRAPGLALRLAGEGAGRLRSGEPHADQRPARESEVRGGFHACDRPYGAAAVRRGGVSAHCQRLRDREGGGIGPQPEALAGDGFPGKLLAERLRPDEKRPGGALSTAPLARS